MTLALGQTELYEQLNDPNNPGFDYLVDKRLQRDIWDIRSDFPSLAEEAHIIGRRTISFGSISLLWLKDLTKLAILVAVGNCGWSLGRLSGILSQTKNFASWFEDQGYTTPSALSLQVVQQWGQNKSPAQKERFNALLSILQQIGCINFRMPSKKSERPMYPQTKTISEEVKEKLDLALITLDPPIYLAFKLHETLGTRSIEIAKLPLNCLRQREGVHCVRILSGKQNDSQQEQDLPNELVLLIQEQQVFMREKFGEDFPWLFPNWQQLQDRVGTVSWPPSFAYRREQLKQVTKKLNRLLKYLIEERDIRTHDGKLAHVTTHMFRRTWATVANRMGKRPDQIMHGLRHLNLEMQDSYVTVLPQEQEKCTARVLVDNSGKRTVYRTDRDSQFLKKEWRVRQVELGICTRPNIQKGCEFEYICLGCEFARYAAEHLPQLLKAKLENEQLLKRCLELGQSDSRRANSARQYILMLDPIITSLLNTTDKGASS